MAAAYRFCASAAIAARSLDVLEADGDAVDAALGVHDRQLDEAAAVRLPDDLAARGSECDRRAVDQPGQRQHAAARLEQQRAVVLRLDLGAIGREGDQHARLEERALAVSTPPSRKRFSGGGSSEPVTRRAPGGCAGKRRRG